MLSDMQFFQEFFIYIALFLSLYFQIFLLLTYFGWSKRDEYQGFNEYDLPSVSIMVPCWNEESTVVKTVQSLLELDYPKNKLSIVIIDDGSTDNTWQIVQQFANNPQIRLFHKENEGSKFAALNYGLDRIHTDIVGCLDADSRVDIQALQHSILPFSDPEVMCVVPSMIIDQPKTLMQYMQKPEYEVGIYLRKVFSLLSSLYIAPGPFTIIRRSVFDKIGYYIEAHHTEDLEIALRMQVNGMKLVHASDSIVYTQGPKTWPALLKQRVRWTYGGMKNIISEYGHILFKKKYGNLGAFILPFSMISIIIAIMLFPFLVWSILSLVYKFAMKVWITGFSFSLVPFDSFFISLHSYTYLSLFLLCITMFTLYVTRRKILKTRLVTFDLLTFFIYPVFASWWTIRSTYNFITSKKNTWR